VIVHCGVDNDACGNKLWAQVRETYPRAEAIMRERPPSGAKDWNDALRAVQGREESRPGGQREEREQTHDHGHGGRGTGGRARDDTPDTGPLEVGGRHVTLTVIWISGSLDDGR